MKNSNLHQLFAAMNADDVNIVDCDAYDLQRSSDTFVDSDFTRIDAKQALYMQVGDVALVRSKNVKSLGDHYIVVTGRPIEKPHGLRPQTIEIPAIGETPLSNYGDHEMLVILKMNNDAKQKFFNNHNICFYNDQITFPTI